MSEDLLTRRIIGAAIEVHRILGPGLLESVYEFALCCEFEISELAYRRQVPANMMYKGHAIKGQRLDFVVENGVVVELKAAQGMPPTALAQILTYLLRALCVGSFVHGSALFAPPHQHNRPKNIRPQIRASLC